MRNLKWREITPVQVGGREVKEGRETLLSLAGSAVLLCCRKAQREREEGEEVGREGGRRGGRERGAWQIVGEEEASSLVLCVEGDFGVGKEEERRRESGEVE